MDHGDGFQFGYPNTPVLQVPDCRLDWFCSEIARIHAVELSSPSRPSRYEAPTTMQESIRAAVQSLRREVQLGQLMSGARLHEPLDDPLLGRILIATDFDVAKSAGLVRAYVDFRRGLGGGVRPTTEQDGTFIIPFEDGLGRPVLLIRGNRVDPQLPVEHFQRRFRAAMDAMIVHFLLKRTGNISASNPLEQYVCVIETKGAGWSNVSLAIIKMLVQETNVYYPDRLQEIIVLGVTASIKGIWRLASPLVHPRTRKKVNLVRHGDIQTTMLELVPATNLPSTYGGVAPPFPDPAEATGLDAAAGAIAAAAWRQLGLCGAVAVGAPRGNAAAAAVARGGRRDTTCGCFGRLAWR